MSSQSQLSLIDEKVIPPLVEILDEVVPKVPNTPPSPQVPSKSLEQSLDDLFPEQQHEEKKFQKTKEILGSLANEFTPIQLKEIVTKVEFLTASWVDDFEREIFNGQTLNELLHEKGRV